MNGLDEFQKWLTRERESIKYTLPFWASDYNYDMVRYEQARLDELDRVIEEFERCQKRVSTVMMYILTEEEYFNLSESRNDLPKLKAALKKECDELNHKIDVYHQLGSEKMTKALAVRLNTILMIIDKYL